MNKRKAILFAVLALISLGMAGYAAAVIDDAPSPFDVALLVFAVIAAITSVFGSVISFLSFRLEAGRVPRPSIAMRLPDGSAGMTMLLRVHIEETPEEFPTELARRRRELDAQLENAQDPPAGIAGYAFLPVTEDDVQEFRKEVDRYLEALQTYLKYKAMCDAFWKRSYVLVFEFENARAGVPASGLRARLHFPEEDDGVRVFPYSEVPDRPEEPDPPSPPRPRDLSRIALGALEFERIPRVAQVYPSAIDPPGNVSGPQFGKGSVLVTYDVEELLHNSTETTERHPIVVSFLRPGTWHVPYEIHARNLPEPRRGTLTLTAELTDEPVSYEPPANDDE